MADTLKQFSDISDKTLSELNSGVTLVSASGSEKLVIKGISVDNQKGRSVDIRLGSTTGTKVANVASTATLSGNEIVDNSQSLVATSGAELVFTDLIKAGWGERLLDHTSEDDPRTRTNSMGIMKLRSGSDSAVFTPDTWVGEVTRSGRSTIPFPSSADDGVSGKDWGESWEDKFGNLWVFGTASDKDFEINGSNASRDTLYKIQNDSSNDASDNLKTFGSCRMLVYDGDRYIYAIHSTHNYIKKYDTHANPTTDTFTQVPVYDCTTGDTTAFTFALDGEQSTCYYRDGYLIWWGERSTGVGSRFSITELATGKTKQLYDTVPSDGNYHDGKGTNGNTRRTLGMTKDSNGDYFAWICNWGSNNQEAGHNFWHVTNMGNDPKTTYIPNSVGTTPQASAKKVYKIDMYNVTHTPGGGSNDHYRMVIRLSDRYGSRYSAPRGATVHTPGIDRYNLIAGYTYYGGSDSVLSTNYMGYYLDFDQIGNQKVGGFYNKGDLKNSSVNFYDGSLQLRRDVNKASEEFGKVSFRTTGISVT